MRPGPGAARQRDLLVGTTAVAVITDATLLPFYPKLFSEAFGVEDPQHVGTYLAMTCLTVMLVLPVWARLERRFSTLELLWVGQLGAGTLALLSFAAPTLPLFWVCSLAMVVFKASYLLVYPYVMRLEDPSRHADTIGLLTVIVHLGGITGATIGGWVLEHHEPRSAFLVMAAGDFLQMLVSRYLVSRGARPPAEAAARRGEVSEGEVAGGEPRGATGALVKLGLVMAAFYLCVFIVRPFFVPYWLTRSPGSGELVSGWVYSIPAWASLVALAVQRAGWSRPRPLWVLLVVAAGGLAAQCLWSPWLVIAGRFVFGWAVFRAMVDLDLVLFRCSPPSSYARDFSRMNLCQQGGVLVAFSAAGTAVAAGGLLVPFLVAIVGVGCLALAHATLGEVLVPMGAEVRS